jgi:hypothetical protein
VRLAAYNTGQWRNASGPVVFLLCFCPPTADLNLFKAKRKTFVYLYKGCRVQTGDFSKRTAPAPKPLVATLPGQTFKMKFHWTTILLYLIILFDAGVFLLYGVAKLTGFQFVYHAPEPGKLLQDVRPLGIMWYFFSLKKGYAVLVALAEIVPAILILFKRTRFLGIILYLVTVTNILAINVFFGITPYTLGLSIILFVNALIILFSERQKLKTLLS